MLKKIISGGQTGVDRAALDAAIDSEVEYGGWLPAGRKTEDGPLPKRYKMDEMNSPSYPDRTRKNVMEADATLIISRGQLTGGSALTEQIAKSLQLPCYHLDVERQEAMEMLFKWLDLYQPDILNVAGPRGSSDGMIYEQSYKIIVNLIKVVKGSVVL